MNVKTLEEKIEELSNYTNFEEKQLYNWLKQLKEYIDRDTPMKITHTSLSGQLVCPRCDELMSLGVKSGFCKKVMPMFSTASDQDIKDNCAVAKLTTYADNLKLFSGTAKTIYTDMCNVWASIGESTNKDLVNTIFDGKYIETLAAKYNANDYSSSNTNTVITEDNEQDIINSEALLTKSTTVNFVANTARFLDSGEATKKLDEFIEIARVLDGSIIQIEGNIASNNDSKDGISLSKQRAETVKKYFVLNGISADRIVTVGNGGSKPVAPNNSEANMQKNRRTDISFKCLE